MKYILQINTGNIETTNYTSKQIIDRLEHVLNYIEISKIIIGWSTDKKIYEEVVTYLHNKKIEVYFWLPVFSEITDLNIEDKYVEANIFTQNNSNFSSGDKFEFVCQASNTNINYIVEKFKEITKGINFDGVFLDRIRYNSPAVNPNAILGCLCPDCLNRYKENGIDIVKLQNENVFDYAIPVKIHEGVYEYIDSDFNSLMKIKRDTITKQINAIIEKFNEMDLKVGLDTFGLAVADFVGQDIISLSKKADFIKPMFYLRTTAPAGIPYELNGLTGKMKESLKKLWGFNIDDVDSSVEQCKYLLDRNVYITPGIDVNNIEGICSSDKEYVLNYLDNLSKLNLKEVVLSWNAMTITDELLEKL